MEQFLMLIVIASLFIQGWHYCLLPAEGNFKAEIFHFVKEYGEKITPKFFHKPLFNCPVCMSSVYGSLFYWSNIEIHHAIINSYTMIIWVVFCVAVAGLSRLLTKIIIG